MQVNDDGLQMDAVGAFFPLALSITFPFKITVMLLGKIIKVKQLGNCCHLVVSVYYCIHSGRPQRISTTS